MKLHLVGGFLGSGKTTAIIQASRLLMGRGLRVGVITNDQGKYLVDTAFMRLSDLPAVEVTGGCFCCNYDDLNGRLEELLDAANPHVVFAESVGSCADIVATVVKPMLELDRDRFTPASFSVFTDGRLLLRRLRGLEMPFSDDVMYIFDKQIEEAGLVVVNKADLLASQAVPEVEKHVERAFPGKPLLMQTSLSPEGVWNWVNLIHSGKASPPASSLEIDYGRYAAGEAVLAWLNQEVQLTVPEGEGKPYLAGAIRRLAAALERQGAGIGHIKFFIQAENVETKLSIPTLEEPGWEDRLPDMSGMQIRVLVNARAELGAQELMRLLKQSMQAPGVLAVFREGEAFHPGEPKPVHRLP